MMSASEGRAYQAPLALCYSRDVLDRIRQQLSQCEADGIEILRANVTGSHGPLTSYGSSAIVAPDARVVAESVSFEEGLVIASVTLPG